MRRFVGIGVVVIILGLLLGFAAWLSNLYGQHNKPTPASNLTTYQRLLLDNPAFAQGVQAYKEGNVSEAETLLNTALQSARTAAEEGRIQFTLATVIEARFQDATTSLSAIPLLKQIAANTSYPNIIRATAVQEMGAAFYISGDSRYTAEIFNDPPYASLYVPGNVYLSYQRLFEYAASLYPLAYSELRIASNYANQIFFTAVTNDASLNLSPERANFYRIVLREDGSGAPQLTPGQIAAYQGIIQQDVVAANENIASIQSQNDPNGTSQIPALIQREAVVAGRLQNSGDESFADAETLFKKDLALYASISPPGFDGFTRYYYATFLALQYGTARASDIDTILAPLYANPSYKGSNAQIEFTSERNNIVGDKPYLQILASIDPQFKAYLVSLGWTSADFETTSTVSQAVQ